MSDSPRRAGLRLAHSATRPNAKAAQPRTDESAWPARAEAELQWGTSSDIPLEALYARYAPYVAAIAMRVLGRESEVEDLVQDVFAISVRGLRRRRNHGEIKRWLATVTVRRCTHRLRVLSLWSRMDLDDARHFERIADPSAGPDERRLVAQVYRALDRLPIRDRVAWVLRHVEGESLQEVAALCGCSLATAKRRIARAHARITAFLQGSARHGS